MVSEKMVIAVAGGKRMDLDKFVGRAHRWIGFSSRDGWGGEGKRNKRELIMLTHYMESKNVKWLWMRGLGGDWTKARVLCGRVGFEMPIRHLCWMLETEVG